MFIRKAFLFLPSLVAALFIALSPAHAGSVTGDSIQDYALQQQLQQINDLARAKGATLNNLQVHRSVQLGASASGKMMAADSGTSCTVTAQVIIAGVGATISATAPTCSEAAQMIADYVRRLPHMS